MKVFCGEWSGPTTIKVVSHKGSFCLRCFRPEATIALHSCNLCYDCCVCVSCVCTRVLPFPACGICRSCPLCCTCIRCASCSLIYGTPADGVSSNVICSQCGNGIHCCCPHGSNIREGATLSSLYHKYGINLTRYIDPPHRLIAAEIEICGFKNQQNGAQDAVKAVTTAWRISGVSDGSLPSGGIEFNTYPAAGKYWTQQILDLEVGLHHAKAWVNERAGCHIHIDCRDFSYLDLAKLVRLIGCLEPALFSLIPASRRDNHFCHFWAINYLRALQEAEAGFDPNTSERKQTLAYRKRILSFLYGFHQKKQVDVFKSRKSHTNRYRAFNVHSFLYRGTIEFRMPPGTIYAVNIINWGLLLESIVQYAKIHTMKDVIAHCRDIEQSSGFLGIPQLSGCHYTDIPKAQLTQSSKFLEYFAPSRAVRDWIHERQKWANILRSSEMFLEQS